MKLEERLNAGKTFPECTLCDVALIIWSTEQFSFVSSCGWWLWIETDRNQHQEGATTGLRKLTFIKDTIYHPFSLDNSVWGVSFRSFMLLFWSNCLFFVELSLTCPKRVGPFPSLMNFKVYFFSFSQILGDFETVYIGFTRGIKARTKGKAVLVW